MEQVDNQGMLRLRLFGGLREVKKARIEEESFPYSPGLTVGELWGQLQGTAEPDWLLVRLSRDGVLALVNGTPIQRLVGWETPLAVDDTVTFMVKAFGG